MDRPRSLLMTAALMIAAAGIATTARSQPARDGKPTVLIEGLAPEEWIAALDDPDPARRKWALLILGRATPDQALGQFARLQDAVNRVKAQDRDPDVRAAAARSSQRQSSSLDASRRAAAKRERNTVQTPLRLVDAGGQPVAGAVVSTLFRKDADRSSSFEPHESRESKTSDAKGEASLGLEVPRHMDATAVYAIRRDKDRPLVGLSRIARDQLGKPITIVMHPACRVRVRVECPGFRELGETYHFELDGSCWWRAASVILGDGNRAPEPLFTDSTTGQLEFHLPPGRFRIRAYGYGAGLSNQTVEVGPGHRVRNLEIEVPPNEEARRGIFLGYHHLARKDPGGRPAAGAVGRTVVLRSVKSRPVFLSTRDNMWDLAFSPDGRRLATAHGHDTESAEVSLRDPQTGRLLATWPSPDGAYSVYRLAFSPDGRTLAGSVGPSDRRPPHWEIVLWDVDGRRAPRTLPGGASRITTLAFSPDGQTLVSGTDDTTVTLWDVATGREAGRLDGTPVAIAAMAFSPGGRTLAIAGGTIIDLCDWPGRRLRSRLESEAVAIRSVAFAPDGRSLAVAGRGRDQGRVWRYDLAEQPPSCDAGLTLDRGGVPRPNPNALQDDFRAVAYTPDGRRLVAVGISSVVIWDAATGVQQDFIDRDFDLHYDRLDISPDGRWLAIIGSSIPSFIDLGPVGP